MNAKTTDKPLDDGTATFIAYFWRGWAAAKGISDNLELAPEEIKNQFSKDCADSMNRDLRRMASGFAQAAGLPPERAYPHLFNKPTP